MAVPLKKYKLKINSPEKIEVLLQELYNDACKNIEQVQNEMNKLTNSVNLNDEAMDAKAKYAKAMNDFITSKDKAIGKKLDIAKLMTEILKFNGNVAKTFAESEAVGDWEDLIVNSKENEEKQEESENKRREYRIK
jgi:hypothetical protein